jgi:peroxiredoxin Q/BCP
LRQDYQLFIDRQAVILVVGPEQALEFSSYWRENSLPFIGLPDPRHAVLRLYGQEISLFKLGRMPAQVVIDKNGIARFVHYGNSMMDIPSNEEMIAVLDAMNQESLKSEKPAA